MGGGTISGSPGYVIKIKTERKILGIFPVYEKKTVDLRTFADLPKEQKIGARVATTKELEKAGIWFGN